MNRVLPQTETLCILRYLGDRHEEAWRETPSSPGDTRRKEKEDGHEGVEPLDTPGALISPLVCERGTTPLEYKTSIGGDPLGCKPPLREGST